MHGVIISSFWYFGFAFEAILPDLDGVITLFVWPILLFGNAFRGRLNI
jgi:hypothetical protein